MSLDVISTKITIKTIEEFMEGTHSQKLLDIAESAPEEFWQKPTKKSLTELLYKDYGIASLKDLKNSGLYHDDHTGLHIILNVVDNYDIKETERSMQHNTVDKAGYRISFISHILRVKHHHQNIEFNTSDIVEYSRLNTYSAVGLLFLNATKKDRLCFLDQKQTFALGRNLMVVAEKSPMASFQIQTKRKSNMYVVVVYLH
jgi:hypothetical protein